MAAIKRTRYERQLDCQNTRVDGESWWTRHMGKKPKLLNSIPYSTMHILVLWEFKKELVQIAWREGQRICRQCGMVGRYKDGKSGDPVRLD